MCISNVRQLKAYLVNVPQNWEVSADERDAINFYQPILKDLLQCLEALSVQWSEYCDQVGRPDILRAYCVHVDDVNGRGRPRLCVTLEYLTSLSFTWSEIASVLGVSRMTLYVRMEYGI